MRLADDVARDMRHGARDLWRSPGFSLAVILTLALGIGGNTAVFSVVDQLLLRPLPYPDGDELVMVEESIGGNPHVDVSPANWLDWQRQSRMFRQFGAWRSWSFTMTGAGEPRRVSAQTGVIGILSLLGVAPLLGRTISDEDDRPNGSRVAVLSYHRPRGSARRSTVRRAAHHQARSARRASAHGRRVAGAPGRARAARNSAERTGAGPSRRVTVGPVEDHGRQAGAEPAADRSVEGARRRYRRRSPPG